MLCVCKTEIPNASALVQCLLNSEPPKFLTRKTITEIVGPKTIHTHTQLTILQGE